MDSMDICNVSPSDAAARHCRLRTHGCGNMSEAKASVRSRSAYNVVWNDSLAVPAPCFKLMLLLLRHDYSAGYVTTVMSSKKGREGQQRCISVVVAGWCERRLRFPRPDPLRISHSFAPFGFLHRIAIHHIRLVETSLRGTEVAARSGIHCHPSSAKVKAVASAVATAAANVPPLLEERPSSVLTRLRNCDMHTLQEAAEFVDGSLVEWDTGGREAL